jgi:hypothetical protein
MSKRRSVDLERALQIELLRVQASLERETMALHGQNLALSLNPKRQLESLLGGSQSDLLRQGFGLISRYPLLVSLASNALGSRRWRGLLGVTAGLAGVWWLVSQRSTANKSR